MRMFRKRTRPEGDDRPTTTRATTGAPDRRAYAGDGSAPATMDDGRRWHHGPTRAVMTLLGVGAVGLLAFQIWTLVTRRPHWLVPGVALGTALLLSVGVWLQIQWVNKTQDFPQLAELVERHARGADAGVLGGRFFSVDVYLGRPLTPVRTEPLFLAYVNRPDRPVVLVSERVFNAFNESVRAHLEVLEQLKVRRQNMLIVRAREVGGVPMPPAAASPPSR